MPRGAPDYSNVRAYGPLHRVDDQAELAARLGSIDTYDRRGLVFFMDSFDYGLGMWSTTLVGDNGEISLTTFRRKSGPFAVRFTAPTTSSKYAMIQRRQYAPYLGKLSLEFSFACGTTIDRVGLSMYVDDDVNDKQAVVRYHPNEQKVDYLNTSQAYTDFQEDLRLVTYDYAWHTMKLVIDTENDQYARLLLDRHQWDFEDVSFWTGTLSTFDSSTFLIYAVGDGSAEAYCYIDDVIIKQGEP